MQIEQSRLQEDLANVATRERALDEIGQWAKDTCLMFGATPATAYQVAWLLTEGITSSWEERKPDFRIVR